MFWRWQIAPHVQNRFTAPRGAAGTEDGTRRSREEVPSKRYRERVPVLFRRSSNRGTHTDNHRYMIYIDLVYSYQINTNVYCNIIYIYICRIPSAPCNRYFEVCKTNHHRRPDLLGGVSVSTTYGNHVWEPEKDDSWPQIGHDPAMP